MRPSAQAEDDYRIAVSHVALADSVEGDIRGLSAQGLDGIEAGGRENKVLADGVGLANVSVDGDHGVAGFEGFHGAYRLR